MMYAIFLSILLAASNQNEYTVESKFEHNLLEAKALAKDQNKNILMVFSGSDWCKPCIQFKNEILLDGSFDKFSSENLVILYLDFPVKKKNKLAKELKLHNESLAERFNKEGYFPRILLINPEEKILGEIKFKNQGVNNFIKELKVIST